MNLKTDEWKPFYLKDLYDIQMGNGFDKNKLDEDNPEVNLVSRVSYNNGVDVKVGCVEGVKPFDAGLVTVALGGSYLGSCFVQEEPFYTGQNVAVMKAKCDEMSHMVNVFISGLVRFECKTKYYAFGRELNTHIRRDFDVKLPVKHNPDGSVLIDENHTYSEEGYVPDWQFMEDYMKSLHHKPLTTKNTTSMKLNVDEWVDFCVDKILICDTTTLSIKDDLMEGTTPFISRTACNNGCDGYVDVDANVKTKSNCITVGAEGIYAFYQPEDFATGNKVYSMRNIEMNKYIGLFLCTVLNKEDYRYSYGRARILSKLKQEIIKLPAKHNPDGTIFIDENQRYSEDGYVPDWQFMEDYIKSLPYGDRL